MSALVFDCDGVLADTERYGHLPAFNQTFREFSLPVEWSVEEYGRRLKIGGGKERMASLLTPEFVAVAGLPTDPDEQAAQIAAWHKRKTAIYTEMVAAGKLPPRPGIRRVITAAQDAGWKLGVASTSAEASVHAILEYGGGAAPAPPPARARAEASMGDRNPAPPHNRKAREPHRDAPPRVLVVEDSRNGLVAADAAGLRCLVTVNGYTEKEEFSEAILVVSSLGDPDGEQTTVIANRSAARPDGFVTLADLEACLAP